MEHGSRTRFVTALVLVVVFASGVLLGLAADSSLRAEPAELVATRAESTPEAAADGEAEEPRERRRGLYHQVEPNEAQLSRIDSIVTVHRSRTNAFDEQLRAEYDVGFREILLETREAIKGVLSPEQSAQYQTLLDEYDLRKATERENEDDQN